MLESTLFTPPPTGDSGAEDLSPEGESIELFLRDKRKITGKFLEFENSRQRIKLSLEVKDKSATVFFKLDEIKMLHLLSKREWTAERGFGESTVDVLSQHGEKLEFKVQFTDGKAFSGDAFGFRVNSYGLCLFAAHGESVFSTYFVPHSAMESYEVGPRIGEVLVREKLVSEEDLNNYLGIQEAQRNRPIGDYLSSNMLVSVEEVEKALELQKAFPNLKLGEILLSENLISEAQLEKALEEQKSNREKPLGQILVEAGVVTQKDIQLGLAKKLGIPFVDLRKFPADPAACRLIPESVARKHQVLPLFELDKRLAVALTDPLDYKLLEVLQFHAGKIIDPVFALEEDLERGIELAYKGAGLSEILSDEYLWEETPEESDTEAAREIEGVGGVIIKLVNKLIMDAYLDHASDIHIEPRGGRDKTLVRFRRDGVLRNYYEVPAHLRHALIARIKVMANLDISVKRKPQDGKISFGKFSPTHIDLRVATIPTAGGEEDVVLRLLGSNKPIPLDNLGLSARDRQTVDRIVQKPYGLFPVCGPTGSGKTTSLHSILGAINTPERKIWTAEDPIEITQVGLRQVQMHPGIGLTFAAAMRSFLRADPDVIMVGEMRDTETTHIGIEASLTGHLVLTTLHTNSAPESIVRLIDMGMDPFNFADALLGIMSQRLVRTLCKECKKADKAGEEELQLLAHEFAQPFSPELPEELVDEEAIISRWRKTWGDDNGDVTIFRATGCDVCDGGGYRGRMGIYELLEATPAIKKLIIESAPVSRVLEVGLKEGMRTLKQDGIEKILQGHTDLTQVRKVTAG